MYASAAHFGMRRVLLDMIEQVSLLWTIPRKRLNHSVMRDSDDMKIPLSEIIWERTEQGVEHRRCTLPPVQHKFASS